MKIKKIIVSSKFRYLWLKTVEDVDLSQHCARCLIGEYDSRIKADIIQKRNIELTDSVYYLCGVAFPFDWNNNFHLAFRPCQGSTIHYENNGIEVVIEDAEQLPISQDNVDMTNPKAKFGSYRTCRNWQFAHWFNDNLKSH